MRHPDDSDIIELYFARDEQAIKVTEAKYGQTCMHTAMRILGNHADAEECVNDTWLRTWQSIPPHRPKKLVAFLCRITRNLAISRWRVMHQEMRDRRMTVALHELSEVLPAEDEPDPMLSELLNRYIQALGELDRRLFLGRYFHLYPVSALAKAYGMTQNAVSLRLMRIREKLRDYLIKEGYDP